MPPPVRIEVTADREAVVRQRLARRDELAALAMAATDGTVLEAGELATCGERTFGDGTDAKRLAFERGQSLLSGGWSACAAGRGIAGGGRGGTGAAETEADDVADVRSPLGPVAGGMGLPRRLTPENLATLHCSTIHPLIPGLTWDS